MSAAAESAILPPATIGDGAAYARRRLPRFEADLLACRALDVPRAHLYAFTERAIESTAAARLATWIDRRAAGEPVAYILGERGFWGMDFEVSPATLIPRPDSETLVAAALTVTGTDATVLDIGTGCGALALAIAAERPQARIIATDIDQRCVDLCRRNARRLGLAVETRVADVFEGVDAAVDVIVSNPPYIGAADPHLGRGDLRFEPRRALVGGARSGLDFIARLVREAPGRLKPGGWLCVEHGCEQAEQVADLFQCSGFVALGRCRDLEDRPRVMLGQRRSPPP